MNTSFSTPRKNTKFDPLHCEFDIKPTTLHDPLVDIKPKIPTPKKLVFKCNNCETFFERNGVVKTKQNVETKAIELYYLCEECYQTQSESEESEPENYDQVKESVLSQPPKLSPIKPVPPKLPPVQTTLIDFLCNLCFQQIPFDDFHIHAADHDMEGRNVCWICSYDDRIRTYSSQRNLVRHLILHNENPFQCNQCLYRCSSKDLLDQHFKKSHSDLTVYSCNSCPGIHLDLNVYLDHLKNIHGKDYGCKNCEARFTNLTELEYHQKMKHTEVTKTLTQLMCDICSKVYRHAYLLRTHMETAHGNDKQSEAESQKSEVSTNTKEEKVPNSVAGLGGYKCNYCPKSYSYPHNLLRHHRGHHPEIPVPDIPGVLSKPKAPGDKPKLLVKPNAPTTKLLTPVKPNTVLNFKPCVAEKMTLRPNTPVSKKKEPIAVQPESIQVQGDIFGEYFTCHICHRSFNRKSSFTNHFNTHNISSSFVSVFGVDCTVCHMNFANNKDLCRHLVKHKQITYSCHICCVKYGDPRELQDHLLSHTDKVGNAQRSKDESTEKIPRLSRCKSVTNLTVQPKLLSRRRQSVANNLELTSLNWVKSKLVSDRQQSVTANLELTPLKLDWNHRETQSFLCLSCDQIATWDEIEFHSKLHKIRPFYCPICQKVYMIRHSIQLHMELVHPDTTSTFEVTDNQFKLVDTTPAKYWFCPICCQDLAEFDNEHFQNCVSGQNKSLKCKICDVSFSGKQRIRHILHHSKTAKSHSFKGNALRSADNNGCHTLKRARSETKDSLFPKRCRRASVGSFMQSSFKRCRRASVNYSMKFGQPDFDSDEDHMDSLTLE